MPFELRTDDVNVKLLLSHFDILEHEESQYRIAGIRMRNCQSIVTSGQTGGEYGLECCVLGMDLH
jgi:hypothetical protein